MELLKIQGRVAKTRWIYSILMYTVEKVISQIKFSNSFHPWPHHCRRRNKILKLNIFYIIQINKKITYSFGSTSLHADMWLNCSLQVPQAFFWKVLLHIHWARSNFCASYPTLFIKKIHNKNWKCICSIFYYIIQTFLKFHILTFLPSILK
jgi:hypothetical protein